MSDPLGLLLTDQGILLLMIAFIPGFIVVSLLRHWFNKKPFINFSEIEILMWSILVSIFIHFIYLAPVAILKNYTLTDIFAVNTAIGSNSYYAYGLLLSLSVFIILFGVKENKDNKYGYLISAFGWFFLALMLLGFFSVNGILEVFLLTAFLMIFGKVTFDKL